MISSSTLLLSGAASLVLLGELCGLMLSLRAWLLPPSSEIRWQKDVTIGAMQNIAHRLRPNNLYDRAEPNNLHTLHDVKPCLW